jgi:YggT family protein
VRYLVLSFLQFYLLMLFARVLMSWFPIRVGTAAASLYGILFRLTEPVLRPIRRLLPRTGIFDLSFIVVILGISILRTMIATG